MPLLQVKGLHAHYGKSHILHGIDMEVPEAAIVELRAMLTDAKGAFAAFLKPTFEGDKIGFTLDELIAIARKPA